MTKAVIFDTDGMVVLTDMFSVKYCKEFNVSYEAILPFFQNEFQPCLTGKADVKVQITPYLKKWGWTKSVEELLEYWFRAEHNVDQRVVDLAHALRKSGVRCYLATNQEKYRTEYIRNTMGLGKMFDKIFSSAEIGFKKPQPEYFDAVMNEIGLEKAEVQFWDDTEQIVLQAKEYGLDARQYSNFEEFQKEISILLA